MKKTKIKKDDRPPAAMKPSSVVIEFPLADVTDGLFGTREFDLGHVEARLSAPQHNALVRIRVALDRDHARLEYPPGRLIQTNADALRWMLEQVAGET